MEKNKNFLISVIFGCIAILSFILFTIFFLIISSDSVVGESDKIYNIAIILVFCFLIFSLLFTYYYFKSKNKIEQFYSNILVFGSTIFFTVVTILLIIAKKVEHELLDRGLHVPLVFILIIFIYWIIIRKKLDFLKINIVTLASGPAIICLTILIYLLFFSDGYGKFFIAGFIIFGTPIIYIFTLIVLLVFRLIEKLIQNNNNNN
jgi:hypothetical protein